MEEAMKDVLNQLKGVLDTVPENTLRNIVYTQADNLGVDKEKAWEYILSKVEVVNQEVINIYSLKKE